jgi:hypothetical protein
MSPECLFHDLVICFSRSHRGAQTHRGTQHGSGDVMMKDWVSETSEIKLLVSTLVKMSSKPFTIPIPFLTLIPTFGRRLRHVVLFVKKKENPLFATKKKKKKESKIRGLKRKKREE